MVLSPGGTEEYGTDIHLTYIIVQGVVSGVAWPKQRPPRASSTNYQEHIIIMRDRETKISYGDFFLS